MCKGTKKKKFNKGEEKKSKNVVEEAEDAILI